MNIVVVYTTSDGCTYSYENVIPIYYKSKEDFVINHYLWIEECLNVGCKKFFDFDYTDFIEPTYDKENFDFLKIKNGTRWIYIEPKVYTLEEWFCLNAVCDEN
jgi:hypothetical protein